MKWAVPQGSVLVLVLLNLYISPIEDIILAYRLDVIIYGDDIQVCIIMLYLYVKEQVGSSINFIQCYKYICILYSAFSCTV